MEQRGRQITANQGNGAYSYIDSIAEARRILVEQRAATLVTVAVVRKQGLSLYWKKYPVSVHAGGVRC